MFADLIAEMRKLEELHEEFNYFSEYIMPFAYAQLYQIITLLFLCTVPFVEEAWDYLEWGVVPFSFVLNLCFMAINECASEMELPLGDDTNDVDVNKVVRRLDKHTAALLGFSLGGAVVPNFDLYPEARTTKSAFSKGKERQERQLYRQASSRELSWQKQVREVATKPVDTDEMMVGRRFSGGSPAVSPAPTTRSSAAAGPAGGGAPKNGVDAISSCSEAIDFEEPQDRASCRMHRATKVSIADPHAIRVSVEGCQTSSPSEEPQLESPPQCSQPQAAEDESEQAASGAELAPE